MNSNNGGSRNSHNNYTVFRDARVDRAVTWVLTAVATIAFTVGAFEFRSMRTGLADLRSAMSDISTDVAVLQSEVASMRVTREEFRALEKRLRDVELDQAGHGREGGSGR